MRPLPGAPVALLLLALLSAACTRPAEGSRHLGADVPRWAVAGFDLDFDVRLLGPIAERETGVSAFLDGNRIALFPPRDRIVRVTIPGAKLRAGHRTILLKTGNERARAEVQVISGAAAGAALAGSAAVLIGLFLGIRRLTRGSG